MTVLFYTLGCKVNQYDSEALAELFFANGYVSAQPDQAPDVVVINTCTVTAESDRKGRQAIRRFARTYPNAIIVATGCMPQAVPQKAEKLPAHIVIGNASNHRLPQLIEQYKQNGQPILLHEQHNTEFQSYGICRNSFEGRERAFVKIEDGCNRFCSYCLIPYARGRVRSKPLAVLQQELTALAQNGYKEVVLAGINLTAYGQNEDFDLCDAVALAQATPGIERIRLGSMEPDQFTEKMIDRLASCTKLCPQFHLSLQSGSDSVLSRMNRHYTTDFYRQLTDRLQSLFPACAITTDIMCGFPGETDEEFEQTLQFIEALGFAKIHTFVYSPREGTPAAAMKQVDPAVKQQRAAALNAAAERSANRYMQSQIGTKQTVLFEQIKDGLCYGHTPRYLSVAVPGDVSLIGTIQAVEILRVEGDVCYATLLSIE
ncbi:MAG: tRNA (N(6)-L-threonylcarbamoyladenosine(37)-C(2))-methylthiotransferase MtaB [Clostridia bacterium]|nr:tRNA (N(6)-L-threonylcarbamoyladenosine(37)-C(2))-methylthiotransferase MtaB [Clostridia bacterium]